MLQQRNARAERTGWRDEAISQRHREWGFDVPAVDIDFLLLEYTRGEPVALIEYKNEHAPRQNSGHPSYRALVKLGNKANLPVFAVRYTDKLDNYTVTPLNLHGREWLAQPTCMSENEYVMFLYVLRGDEPPAFVFPQPTYAYA